MRHCEECGPIMDGRDTCPCGLVGVNPLPAHDAPQVERFYQKPMGEWCPVCLWNRWWAARFKEWAAYLEAPAHKGR